MNQRLAATYPTFTIAHNFQLLTSDICQPKHLLFTKQLRIFNRKLIRIYINTHSRVENNYDYIIIGSGFGGSVSALRLSEKGYKVLIIEKGKWFAAGDFPKTNWNLRKWFWMPSLRFFGIMRLSIFRHIVTISGTGVGGGSLVYANTLPIPKSAFFTTGSWSGLADWETELRPFYQKALKMLGADKNPNLFDGDLALKELARQIGKEDKFEHPDVAVFFGKEEIQVKDPYFEGKGPDITGCSFCGACMTGCRNDAKNTLDKNYLFLAQRNSAEILAEHEVFNIIPVDEADGSQGYKVHAKSSTRLFKKTKEYRTKGIILSGGVLGTVKLLLKLKRKSLPLLSERLGDHIRTNNETLISVSTLDKNKDLSKGIAIGSILHTDENSHLEVVRYGSGSGFWKLMHLPYTNGKNAFVRIVKMIGALLKSPFGYFKIYFTNSWSRSTAVLLFMQTIDSTIKFRRNFLGRMVTSVSSGVKPTPDIPESIELTRKYCEIVYGKATSFALEALAGIPSTAHILGGAVMGKDAAQGVINHNNEVFGYRNMYVIDGSMISANPGVNPALSITAIAERAIDLIKPNHNK
jgi:cholesterol oxidase